jgi:hypothetical protein
MRTTQNAERGAKSVPRYILAAVALVFGAATIKAGGDVLFFSEQARSAAGNYVPFVLWGNFIGGFLYVAAGLLLLFKSPHAPRLAIFIAATTLAALIALGIHIAVGGAYEARTLAAMGFRSALWGVIAFVLLRSERLSRRLL